MAFYTVDQVRAAAQEVRRRASKSDLELLREARNTPRDRFNIFLSHSSRDKDLAIGTKKLIEDRGYSVYIDWIEDGELDRAAVDRDRAESLRVRMRQCANLFYAHTPNAALSRWCPWELGYFDGLSQPAKRVFILPILRSGEEYKGQEYLSLYETADLATWVPPARHRVSNIDPNAVRHLADSLGVLRHHSYFL